MRNFGKFLGVYLFTLVAALIATLSFTACNQFSGSAPQPSTDSTYVAKTIEATFNPSFTSVPEVLAFQNMEVEEYSIDATFRSLPESVITNVITVCLKKCTNVTKKDIIAEYRANQSVYDNLGQEATLNQDAQQEDSPTAVTEGQPIPAPLSTSYHYEMDTINGQAVKILVKEEKYESK